MPNCFQLALKGEKEPQRLNAIDEAICAHFGVEVDEVKWYKNWYNTIGLLLACGKSFAEIDEIFAKNDDEHSRALRDINDFLGTFYTAKAWYSPR